MADPPFSSHTPIIDPECPTALPHLRLPKGQLFFLHIPKTAGSAFGHVLRNQFHVREVSSAKLLPEFLDQSKAERSGYRLVSAHLTYDALDRVEGTPTAITILREPIERVLSLYEYQKYFLDSRGTGHAYESIAALQARTAEVAREGLDALLESEDANIRAALSNTQAHYIAGSPPAGSPSPELEEQLLERAKRHLEAFVFFGLAERMQESLDLFSYRFGLCPQRSIEVNATPTRRARDAWPQETLKKIEALNQVDIELYRYGKTLFEEALARMRADLVARFPTVGAETCPLPVAQDPQLDARLHAHYEACYREVLPIRMERFRSTMEFGPLGPGWQAWEDSPGGGYRWTGPGTDSYIDLPLALERAVRIVLKVRFIASWEILRGLTLSINGEPLLFKRLSLGPKWHRITAEASPAQLSSSRPFTRIGLHLPRTLPAREINSASPDPRVLGIAVQSIEVKPTD